MIIRHRKKGVQKWWKRVENHVTGTKRWNCVVTFHKFVLNSTGCDKINFLAYLLEKTIITKLFCMMVWKGCNFSGFIILENFCFVCSQITDYPVNMKTVQCWILKHYWYLIEKLCSVCKNIIHFENCFFVFFCGAGAGLFCWSRGRLKSPCFCAGKVATVVIIFHFQKSKIILLFFQTCIFI